VWTVAPGGRRWSPCSGEPPARERQHAVRVALRWSREGVAKHWPASCGPDGGAPRCRDSGSQRARGWPATAFIGGRPAALATKGRRYNSGGTTIWPRHARPAGGHVTDHRSRRRCAQLVTGWHDMARGGFRGALGRVQPGEGARGASGGRAGRARTPRRRALRDTDVAAR
jgi:hypothetical protein